MKKIISGKRYDTETAKAVAVYYSSYPVNDLYYFEETLYQKRTGEYFIYGSGNAASKYAESCGMNEWRGGEKIIPLTLKKAQEWAEQHLDGAEYESIFGEIDESEEKITTTLSLSPKAHEALKMRSHESGVSMSEYIETLLNN